MLAQFTDDFCNVSVPFLSAVEAPAIVPFRWSRQFHSEFKYSEVKKQRTWYHNCGPPFILQKRYVTVKMAAF
jgi:hypothetical protein